MAGNDVTVVIGIDNKGAITGLKQVGDSTQDVATKADKAGGSLKRIGEIAGGIVLSQGLLKLPGLLTGFIGGASDLNESLSKVRTVFGENSREIEAWAGTAAKSLGMSKGAALEAAGTFGNFLQAMGATSPAATKMSKDMVQLATDLGSFNNANPEEVLLALRSGLSGEAEPLRKFGVALSDAAVKAKAVQMGIGTLGKELTEQEKIQARYAIIMEQTSMAQGDFARTSNGLANQTKILKAMLKDAGDQLGTALLPGIVAVAGALIQLLPTLISVGAAIGGPVLEGFKSAGGVLAAFVQYMRYVNEDGDTLNDWLSHLPGWLQPIAELAGVAFVGLKAAAGLTWEALKELGALAWDAMKEAWAIIQPLLAKAAAYTWEALKELAALSWDKMKDAWQAINDAMGRIPWGKAKEEASDTSNWAAAWDKVKDKVSIAANVLRPFATDLLKSLKENFEDQAKAVERLVRSLAPLEPLLKPIAVILGVTLVAALAAVLKAVELFSDFLTLQFVVVMTGASLMITGLSKTFEGVKWVVDNVVLPAFRAIVDFIAGTVNPGIQALVDKVIDAKDWIGHYLNVAGGYFHDFWNIAKEPIQWVMDKIQSLIDLIGKIPSPGSILGGIGGAVDSLNPFGGGGGGGGSSKSNMMMAGVAQPGDVNSAGLTWDGTTWRQDPWRPGDPTGAAIMKDQADFYNHGTPSKFGYSPGMNTGGGITVNIYASGYVQDVGALADDIDRELRRRVA